MKTLVYTSIYNNLYGTEFGGRISREYHYNASLLNILNINADKFICFTSKEDLNSLEKYFYDEKKVNKEKIEFIIFDLKESKYFDKIHRLKNIEKIKKTDRCFEIQYNKFFWLDLIENKNDYDRIYWFDAGLSHSGIIPTKYSTRSDYDRYFSFSLFNESLLKRLNSITELKPLIVVKNNGGIFFWSQTVPKKYYNEYNIRNHVIGGFFGGKPDDMIKLRNNFENLLLELLDNEDELYMEEQILTCLYSNDENLYNTLKFDDWYKREKHTGMNVKYFYEVLI
jgi:hypothetical protein